MAKCGNPSQSEDLVYFGEHFAGIIDGVTQGARYGRMAAEAVAEGLTELRLDADIIAAETVFTAKVAERISKVGHPMGACAAIYSAFRREVWFFGDVQAVIGPVHVENRMLLDGVFGSMRAIAIEHARLQGATLKEMQSRDPGRASIEPFLVMQRSFANRADVGPYGYAVINGTPIPPALLQVHSVPPGENRVVLASDGYPFVEQTLEESERRLSELLERDPLCFRIVHGTKGLALDGVSYDDRAYLRLEV